METEVGVFPRSILTSYAFRCHLRHFVPPRHGLPALPPRNCPGNDIIARCRDQSSSTSLFHRRCILLRTSSDHSDPPYQLFLPLSQRNQCPSEKLASAARSVNVKRGRTPTSALFLASCCRFLSSDTRPTIHRTKKQFARSLSRSFEPFTAPRRIE